MITPREATRAACYVAILIGVAAVGQWLAINEPTSLQTFRFVNGVVLLFIGIVLLMKWERVQLDLMAHRAEVTGLVLEMRKFISDDQFARNQRVEELVRQAAELARRVAEKAGSDSKERHDEINERLDKILSQPHPPQTP